MNVLNMEKQELKLGRRKIKLTCVRTRILGRLANNLPVRDYELWDIPVSTRRTIGYFRKLGLNIQTRCEIGYVLKDKILIE